MVLPPATPEGLGVILLNSVAETHFSFTNALGLVPAAQARKLLIAAELFPKASWIVALHHHLVEYPDPAKSLSERIGTALINGSWFVRQLRPLGERIVARTGIGMSTGSASAAGVRIVSAPSPVMEATNDAASYFYIQTFVIGAHGRLRLLPPQRIAIAGQPRTDD